VSGRPGLCRRALCRLPGGDPVLCAGRRRARPSLLVRRRPLLDGDRRGGGDLEPDRRGRRLVPVRGQDRGGSPHGRSDAVPGLTATGKNGGSAAMATLTSKEPEDRDTLWTGETGDVDAEVARARAAWSGWAARPLAVRIETLRRFANVVRGVKDEFADLI